MSRVARMLLVFVLCVAAQTQNGDILGTVHDQSGAVVAGVKITAEDSGTGVRREVKTSEDGTYRFDKLPKGNYTITAELAGFKRFIGQNVELATSQVLRNDINLEVGQTTESVTVEASASVVQTDSAELASIKSTRFIDYHPSRLYNVSHWFASATVSATEGYFTFHGSRYSQANVSVDGIQYAFGNNYTMAYGVQEVQAETLNAPAKYFTPVTVNSVTRQGTNDIHGRVDGTLYQNLFAASGTPRSIVPNCTAPSRPCIGYWTGGLNVAGPLVIPKVYNGRNKTFWMFSTTQQKDFKSARPITNLVPNAAQRTGDLSGIPNLTLRNPFTGAPYEGNRIPPSQINSVAAKLLPLYPQPNVPGGNLADATSTTSKNDWYTYTGRIDQNFGNRNRLNFSIQGSRQQFFYDFADRSVVGYMGIAEGKWNSDLYSFGDTHLFSPTIVNEVRFGFQKEGPVGYTATGNSIDNRITELGLQGLSRPANAGDIPVTGPDFNIPGFTPFLGWSTNFNNDYSYHLSENLSIQKSKHTIQVGFEYRRTATNRLTVGPNAWASYAFDGRFTGNGFGDFLLGLPGTITQANIPPTIAARRDTFSVYGQTDWRVSPKLTLNLGVRLDMMTPQTEANGLYFNFDPASGSIVVPDANALQRLDPAWPVATNPVITAQQAHYPDKLVRGDFNNLFPRFGFAWRPWGGNRTVVRGGYGIYLVPDAPYSSSLLQTGGPFALSTTVDNVIRNGQALVQFPAAVASGGTYRTTPDATYVAPDWRYPYTQQWNLTFEQEIAGQGLRISYIGSKDTALAYRRDMNKPAPSTIPFTRDRLNYPSYQVITAIANGSTAQYNAFETNLRLRGKGGLTGEIGYAWAKQMTDVPNGRFESLTGLMIQNSTCRACERARSESVPLHRMFAFWQYELPFGRGRKFGTSTGGFTNQLIGNWLISGTFKARTGLGFTPTYTGSDPSNTNTFTGRPDLVGDPTSGSDVGTPDKWYNPAAFQIPAANSGRFGNVGRNVIDGPGMYLMNLGVYKGFPINERVRLLLSATSDNVLNKVNYSLGFVGDTNTPPINAANAGLLTTAFANDYSQRAENYMRRVFFSLAVQF